MFPNLVSKIIDEGIGIGELTNIYKYSIFLGTTGVIMIISESVSYTHLTLPTSLIV